MYITLILLVILFFLHMYTTRSKLMTKIIKKRAVIIPINNSIAMLDRKVNGLYGKFP